MATNIFNIPPNAVEMLFVEDLMQWLLGRQVGIHYMSGKVGPYRDFVFHVFDDDFRKAINFIDMSLEDQIEEDFSNLEELTEASFTEYAFRCEEIYFKNGFLADDFLKYCVRLVSMAIDFNLLNVPEALNITFHNILKLLEDRRWLTGWRNTVIEAARNYAKIYDDLQNVATPDVSEDELLADDLEDRSRADYADDVSQADRTEDLSQADSSANNLDINKEITACDSASNRDPSQNTKTDTDNLSLAKEGLHAEESPKLTPNTDFSKRRTL